MKKFYRGFGYIGGVCEGLGKYFNVDPIWVRLLFCAGFCYGSLWIYILFWVFTEDNIK
jgi:phage shock protein PspC (stress-responsive transcriptional regulator)